MRAGQRWVRLAIEGELGAAVLLPAGLVLFGAELLLLAVADDAQAGGSDAGGDQCGAGGVGTVLAERQVVLSRPALVGVSAVVDLLRQIKHVRTVLGSSPKE